MEFFRNINVKTTEETIQQSVSLKNLSKISTEILNLNEPSTQEANIGGIWGEFTLIRNQIKGGVRFALLECPNALCWTITTGFPPNSDSVIIHLTINRSDKNQEFIEEIDEFLDDMSQCLIRFLKVNKV